MASVSKLSSVARVINWHYLAYYPLDVSLHDVFSGLLVRVKGRYSKSQSFRIKKVIFIFLVVFISLKVRLEENFFFCYNFIDVFLLIIVGLKKNKSVSHLSYCLKKALN